MTVVKPGLPTTADLYALPLDSKPAKRSMLADKVPAHAEKLFVYTPPTSPPTNFLEYKEAQTQIHIFLSKLRLCSLF